MDVVRRSARSTGHALSTLKDLVRSGASVLFITGAGISVASGIATFRGDPTAVWSARTIEFGRKATFSRDPLRWYNDFWLAGVIDWDSFYSARPNAAHNALAEIARDFPAVRVVTQNIDRLHCIAPGTIPRAQFLRAHGVADNYRCELICDSDPSAECRAADVQVDLWAYAAEDLRAKPRNALAPLPRALGRVPTCSECKRGRLRPACLMFDEDYETQMWATYEQWIGECAGIAFVGSSNAVGLTAFALAKAKENNIPLFNFNVTPNAAMSNSGASVCNITGLAERTVPLLRDEIFRGDPISTAMQPEGNA
jgi:NAD-dependent deacetylase